MGLKKNKILLFYPLLKPESNVWLPLSLLALAPSLLKEGFEVEIIDSRIVRDYKKQIAEKLSSSLCLAVSVMTGIQIKGAIEISEMAKKLAPEVSVVWGGYHPTLMPESVIDKSYVDVIVTGQGQETFRELCLAMKDGLPLRDVEGIVFKDSGTVVKNKPRGLKELDELSPLRFDGFDFDVEPYVIPDIGKRTVLYYSSQGCPYGCGFCADSYAYSRRWVKMSAGRLSEDIEYLAKVYGIDSVVFADTNFFVDMNRVKEFCSILLDKKISLNWAADIRTDQLVKCDEDTLTLFKKAGLKRVLIGAEAGSGESLGMAKKTISVEDTMKSCEICARYGIEPRFTTVLGFPGETEGHIDATLDLIARIKQFNRDYEVHTFFYAPFPGTPMFTDALTSGYSPPEGLEGWADYDLTDIHTLWVPVSRKRMLNRYVRTYVPMASPSIDFRRKMNRGLLKYIYRLFNRTALWRIRRRYFGIPFEGWSVGLFKTVKRLFK